MRLVRNLSVLCCCVCCLAKEHPDWEALRQQAEAQYQVPDPLPKLAAQPYDKFGPVTDVSAERVSYGTEYGLRVPAVVYRGAGASIEQHPGLVIVNKQQDDKSAWYTVWAGILYARAGGVVLTYDPIGQYERNPDRQNETVPEQPGLTGLTATDALQGARYLASRKDVDPKRIAILGFSAAAVACAVDTEIAACVLADSAQDLSRLQLDALANQRSRVLVTDNFLGKSAALWLYEKLKFSGWTKKQLEHMPETTVEGTTALGEKVSGIPRSDLHTLPDAVWQAQRDDYIYDSWVQRARQPLH